MKSRLQWYFSRLKTMNVGEVIFRADQARQRITEKTFPSIPVMGPVEISKSNIKFPLEGFNPSTQFHIFGKELFLNEPIDFHEDIFSNRKFPLTFSKTIDMRTDRFGSAKAVWEVNRLQFLIPVLLNYKITGEQQHLDRFVELMKQWDVQNPYMKGLNWYSNIEVNIRLINWYWCWMLLEEDPLWKQEKQYEEFRQNTWLPLIYKHCYYSARNPSRYSSANNHLIAEYTGLFMATTLWKFKESAGWMKNAKAGLEKEILLQHSDKGVNREEADAYIQFITDFFLQAFIAGQHQDIPFSSGYEQRLQAICSYIHNLLDIRNNIPGYGDNDDGRVIMPDGKLGTNNFVSILNTASVLYEQPEWKRAAAGWDIKSALLTAHINGRNRWEELPASSKEITTCYYRDEGHFILKKRDSEGHEFYCHFDAAPLGYLSIAAHGHADALSVIVHVDGYPFLVDPGTYAYHTHQEWRNYFTSTLAHNTVTIDGENQALMAGPTLWLDHYKVTVTEASTTPGADTVCAYHNGYRSRAVRHERCLQFDKKADILVINDEITAENPGIRINMPFHLHPQVIVLQKAANIYLLRHPETQSMLEITLDAELQTEKRIAADEETLAWYSSGFMKKEKSTVLMGTLVSERNINSLTTIIKLIA